MVTFYINKDRGMFDPEADSSKIRADRQGPKKKDNSLDFTYLKPNLDRAQILLEAYNIETKFQEQKLQVLTTYMNMYEHLTDPAQIKRFGQTIINVISERPELDFKADYFVKSYLFSGKALERQVIMLEDVYNFMGDKQREFIKKFEMSNVLKKYDLNENRARLSPVSSGIPKTVEADCPITFHSDRLPPIDALEITGNLHAILDVVDKVERSVDEFARLFEDIRGRHCIRSFARYVVWEYATDSWMSISQINFDRSAPQTIRKLNPIEDYSFFDNPYIPDLLLRGTH